MRTTMVLTAVCGGLVALAALSVAALVLTNLPLAVLFGLLDGQVDAADLFIQRARACKHRGITECLGL